jgi:Flp pilus assembly protein CpaB
MTMLGRVLSQDGAGTDTEPTAGRLGTRVALPRGRAVVGGLLVALAAVGLLLAHQAATRRHATDYLVARHSIPAGSHIRSADLAFAPMDLYAGTAAHAFRTSAAVLGSTATTDIGSGELIQRSAVGSRRAVTSGPARRLTLDLDPARALDGSVVAGDRVDIIGSGDDADTTSVIARRVLVVAIRHPSEGLGSSDTTRLTLVVASEGVARDVIDASLHGKIALVTGAGHGG